MIDVWSLDGSKSFVGIINVLDLCWRLVTWPQVDGWRSAFRSETWSRLRATWHPQERRPLTVNVGVGLKCHQKDPSVLYLARLWSEARPLKRPHGAGVGCWDLAGYNPFRNGSKRCVWVQICVSGTGAASISASKSILSEYSQMPRRN